MNHPVILFDGVCNYCNAMVNFAIKWNKKRSLRFAPLQSDVGAALLKQYSIPENVDSVVFIEDGKAYTFSTAALKICKSLDLPVRLLFILILVPAFIREPLYKWVAKNRYKWFGKKETCMIPSKEVKELFLQ